MPSRPNRLPRPTPARPPADRRRGTAAERGYGSAWQKARLGHLANHPLCVRCAQEGRLTEATVVDHKTPHKGDRALFWDRANWQSLCSRCHGLKTATEDGGFGHPTKGA